MARRMPRRLAKRRFIFVSLLTCLVIVTHVQVVVRVDILVQRVFDEILRLVACQLRYSRTRGRHTVSEAHDSQVHLPLVDEDQLEIQAGTKHEHVGVHLDFSDGIRRKTVADCTEADVLVATRRRGVALEAGGLVEHVSHFRVAGEVDDLHTSGHKRSVVEAAVMSRSPYSPGW